MKLTRYGFHLDLLGFSSFLSVLGIIVSIIGIIGGIVLFCVGSQLQNIGTQRSTRVTIFVIGGVSLLLMLLYLNMWILLKIKTNKQDIPGIEKIGKVYSYVSGSLEIIGTIALIIFSIIGLLGPHPLIGVITGYIIGSAIYLIFACLKIHGIRVGNIKLLGTYLGFRYALFILYMIAFIVLGILTGRMAIAALITGIVYFIMDIGLTVILHSIRVDRETNARTMNDELVDREKNARTMNDELIDREKNVRTMNDELVDLSNYVKDVEEGEKVEKVEATAEHGDGEMKSDKQV